MDQRLGEIFDSVQKYTREGEDAFTQFRDGEFFRYGPQERVAVLMAWDQKMEHETKLTRSHAELVAKKRELDLVHSWLSRAGR